MTTTTARRIPGHTCSTPGCRHIVEAAGGRCQQCLRRLYRDRDAKRSSRTARGYDAIHDRLRLLAFQRDGWTCVDCGWQPDCVRQCYEVGIELPPSDVILEELRRAQRAGRRHLHGEHDTPIAVRRDLRTDLDNYRTRCNVCHSIKSLREQRGAAKSLMG